MSEETILVVEDEPSFADALAVGLAREGFRVVVADDGGEAIRLFEDTKPDLVLLDVMLPTMSGIDVCRTIRSKSTTPIIMVTAKGEEVDAIVGLEVGADDYVTKPYGLRELIARMRAVMRRADVAVSNRSDAQAHNQHEPLCIGEISIDVHRHEVVARGELVRLPLKEFELLSLLMQNAGNVLTRDVLIDRIWGFDYVGDTKTLDVHIKRLRSKIEVDPKKPTLLITIRGLGYKFSDA